jgi:hypothetical protein
VHARARPDPDPHALAHPLVAITSALHRARIAATRDWIAHLDRPHQPRLQGALHLHGPQLDLLDHRPRRR